MVEIANLLLGPQLDAQLKLDGSREWERECDDVDSPACLTELERVDAGAPDSWVVGLVGSLPQVSHNLDQQGHAQALGRHIVLHGMSELDEQDDFGLVPSDAREAEVRAARRERRRHKGAIALMHAFGHTLGSLHTTEAATVMAQAYDPEQAAFTADTTDLLTSMIDERLQGQSDAQLGAYYRLWLEEHAQAFVPAEREQTLAALSGVDTSSAVLAARARELSPLNDPSLAPLTPQDRAIYEGAIEQSRAGKTDAALASVNELAQRYPNVSAVQHFACDLAKQHPGAGASPSCARAEQAAADAHN